MRLSIYQLKPDFDYLDRASFKRFIDETGDTPKRTQYNKVFTGVVDDNNSLEDIFDILVNDLPETYKGSDFGVSDIIGIETDGDILKAGNYYYCDNIGWDLVRSFNE